MMLKASAIGFFMLVVACLFFRLEAIRREIILPKTYGLNDVSLRMRATWVDPMATDLDPRRLLLLGAEEIERFDPANPVAKEMRDSWSDPFSPERSPRNLMRRGADEIDRLESERRLPERERDVRRGPAY